MNIACSRMDRKKGGVVDELEIKGGVGGWLVWGGSGAGYEHRPGL